MVQKVPEYLGATDAASCCCYDLDTGLDISIIGNTHLSPSFQGIYRISHLILNGIASKAPLIPPRYTKH